MILKTAVKYINSGHFVLKSHTSPYKILDYNHELPKLCFPLKIYFLPLDYI